MESKKTILLVLVLAVMTVILLLIKANKTDKSTLSYTYEYQLF